MILLINLNRKENTLAVDEFIKPILKIVGDATIKHYLEITQEDVKKADRIILSGTNLKDNEFLNNVDTFEWIKTYNKPILGICAGMHVVGKALGCELKKSLEIGMTMIETLKENKLFSGSFEAYELHGLVMEPHEQFNVLAKSEKCIQVVKHKQKEIYGVMFHPEVRNEKIIENFTQL